MTCNINWNKWTHRQWEQAFSEISESSLLQSYDYARAICPLYKQRARWGVIEIGGVDAGLVQIVEAGLMKNLIHAIMLDRGPLWFDGFGDDEQVRAFFDRFNREFPRRFGRRRRIIPEIADSPASRSMFETLGYERQNTPGYQTIWIDLSENLERLRSGMKQKWRNALQKAEKSELSIEWDRQGDTLPWFLKHYALDKARKAYDGPSVKLSQALGESFARTKNILIGRANLDNQGVAAILILCHGRTATYQIGWSGDSGRKTAAHNLLLWRAITFLKEANYEALDLGGINDETAKGVKRFKEGLGGRTVRYIGHYR